MRNPFSPSLNCERDSLVTSSTVVLTDVPAGSTARILSSDNSGTLIKNGADAGQSTSIQSGDELRIQTRTSPNFATPLFVAFEIAGEPGAWSVVTKPSDVKVKYSGYAGIIDQSLVEAESLVSDYGPDVTFVHSKYSKAGDFLDQGPVNAVAAPLHASIIPDYYSSSVIQLDQDGNAIGRIVIGAQPWAVTVAAAISWVTVTRLNAVYGIDNTGKIVAVLACGARPLGIASYKRADGKWVVSCVCRGDSSVHSWVLSASGAVESHSGSTLPTASPLDIAYRSGGDLLISTVSNLLAAPAGSSIAAYSGGAHKRLRYCAANDTIYAHVSGVSNPSIIGWAGMYGPGLNIYIDTDVCDFAVSAPGEIATVRFTTGAIGYYKNNVKVGQFQVDPYPYAVRFAADGTLAVENMYGPPSQLPDQTPDVFDLGTTSAVPQRTTIESAPWTVAGVDLATPAACASAYSAVLKKNGVSVGRSTTVVTGDTLALTFVTPHVEAEAIDIPVYVGTVGTSYRTVTAVEDETPDLTTFKFADSTQVVPGSTVRSSTFTVSSIDPMVTLPLSIASGKLFLNGVAQPGLTATVKLGDAVFMEIVAPAENNRKASIEVVLDRWSTSWAVLTKVVPVYWIRPELLGVGQFDIPFVPTIIAKLVRTTFEGVWANETDLHALPDTSTLQLTLAGSYGDALLYGTAPFLRLNSSSNGAAKATRGFKSGKIYWEVSITSYTSSITLFPAVIVPEGARFVTPNLSDENEVYSVVEWGNTDSATFGCLLDLDNLTFTALRNGVAWTGSTLFNSGRALAAGTKLPAGKSWIPALVATQQQTPAFNFGDSPFRYSVPAGYTAAAKVGTVVQTDPYMFVPSFYENCVYRVSTGGDTVERLLFGVNARPFKLTTSPNSSPELSRHFLTLAGQNAVVEIASVNPAIQLPGSPRGISGRADGSRIYVAIPGTGQIVILRPTTGTGPYEIEKVLNVDGEPYELIVWGTKLIFSDRQTNVLRVLEADDTISSTTFAAGQSVWDMKIAGGSLYTANAYDNTVSQIVLATGVSKTLNVGSAPNALVVNPASSRVFVSHYGQNELMEVTGGTVRPATATQRQLSDVLYATTGFFGVGLYSNLALGAGNPEMLIEDTPMNPLAWPTFVDAENGETVRSEVAVVSGVTRTMLISSPLSTRYKVFLNGMAMGESAIVKNGDRLYIEVYIPIGPFEGIEVVVSSFNVDSKFRVEPTRVRTMRPVTFIAQDDVPIRANVKSNDVTVAGLSPDTESKVWVSTPRDVEWSIVLNGIEQPRVPTELENGLLVPAVFLVKNGDVLSLYGISRGQYNSVIDYALISGGVSVGVFRVSNKKLDGIDSAHSTHLEVGHKITADVWIKAFAERQAMVDSATGMTISSSSFRSETQLRFLARTASEQLLASAPSGVAFMSSEQLLASAPSGVVFMAAKYGMATALSPAVFRSSAILLGPEKAARIDRSSDRPMVEPLGVDLYESQVRSYGQKREYEQRQSHPPSPLDDELTYESYSRAAPSTSLARAFVTRSGNGVLLSPVMVFRPFPQSVQRTAETTYTKAPQSIHPAWGGVAVIFRTKEQTAIIMRFLTRLQKVPTTFEQPFVTYARKIIGIAPEMLYVARSTRRVETFEAAAIKAMPTVGQTFPALPIKAAFQVQKGVEQVFDKMAHVSTRLLVREAPIALNRNLVEVDASTGERAALRDHRYLATDSAAAQGVFTTPARAIEYAAQMGFPNAVAVAVNGTPFYTWSTPSPRQNADCAVAASKFPIPHKWYVHGG